MIIENCQRRELTIRLLQVWGLNIARIDTWWQNCLDSLITLQLPDGALLLFFGLANSMSSTPAKRIAIIGAGPAGATAIDAFAQEQTFDIVRVLERREAPDGYW